MLMLSLAGLFSLKLAAKPRPIVPSQRTNASVQSCKQTVVRVSGSDGSGADPERAMPAVAATGAKAPHKPDKRRADKAAADADAYDQDAPSVVTPGKRRKAAAAGAPSGDGAVMVHAALGAAEAEARCGAGEAVEQVTGAALRRMGVRKTAPQFAAALAHEHLDHAEQVRISFHSSQKLAALQGLFLQRTCCAERL